MNFNFFQWLREGVRHSVLTGLNDAVQHIGTPANDDQLAVRLGDYLRTSAPGEVRARVEGPGPSQKKRLGRSLRDLSPAEKSGDK